MYRCTALLLFLGALVISGCQKVPTGFSDPKKITQKSVSITPKKKSNFTIANTDDLFRNQAPGLIWYSTKYGYGLGQFLGDEWDKASKLQKDVRLKMLSNLFVLAKENGAQAVRVSAKNSKGKRKKFEAWLLVNQVAQEAKGPAASSYELTLPPEYVDAVEKGFPFVYLEKIQYPDNFVGNAWILFSGF